MPNPEKQTTGTCGLCKVRLIAGPTIKAIIPDLRDMLPNERKNFQQYYKKIYRKVIPNAPKRESIAEMARRRGLTPVSRGIEKWTDDSLLESQT